MKQVQPRRAAAMLGSSMLWLLAVLLMAVLAGSASALLLFALEWATATRTSHRWLVWLLPVAGFGAGWIYLHYGKSVEGGNNQLIAEINQAMRPTQPQQAMQPIPLRMAPLVLGGTVVSHLFGASVGREGTALQMGGALAEQVARLFRLTPQRRAMLLTAGISAGFASVFGTPLAGAVFALEVLAIGRLRHESLLACLIAAVCADQVGLLWGAQHTHYAVAALPAISVRGLLMVAVAGLLFGLTARLFSYATGVLSGVMQQRVKYAPLRPFLGGCIVALAAMLLGDERYLGLGIPTIVDAFAHPLAWYDFAVKLAYTALSLGSGFKGGEVTPLFYIGATLGNALAPLLQMPLPLMAGIGFVAVFAGAANTPLASTLMAMEMFGADIGVYAALACVVAYLVSGTSGIYHAQRSDDKFG